MMSNFASFDKIVSNLIVCTSYLFTILLWFYYFNDLGVQSKLLSFNFPYGILVLAFLFFGNKVVFGLLFAQLLLYFLTLNYNLSFPFKDYFIISLLQLACVPITLYILGRFNYTVGVGSNYKLDKTNIYHVLLIVFISTIVLGTFIILSSVFFKYQINLLSFVIGTFLGGVILILAIKLVVNLSTLIKRFFQTN